MERKRRRERKGGYEKRVGEERERVRKGDEIEGEKRGRPCGFAPPKKKFPSYATGMSQGSQRPRKLLVNPEIKMLRFSVLESPEKSIGLGHPRNCLGILN